MFLRCLRVPVGADGSVSSTEYDSSSGECQRMKQRIKYSKVAMTTNQHQFLTPISAGWVLHFRLGTRDWGSNTGWVRCLLCCCTQIMSHPGAMAMRGHGNAMAWP